MPTGPSIDCPRCGKSNLPGFTRCSTCGTSLSLAGLEEAETRALDRPAPSAPAPALTSWGPFRLLERVGQGSFGEVYRAFDTTLEREVALKLLLPRYGSQGDDAMAVLREARSMARVRHPNVVPVYGVDSFDSRVGFWSDFVHGKTLSALLSAQGRFSPQEAALIGIDLAKAVNAVHAAGLLHRDIKASNVMREEGGRILLMDFGLSLAGGQRHGFAGSPPYMAPELFAGQPASVESDIYALGVLLYQLLTAKYPIDATTISAIRAAHEAGARRSLYDERPDLPKPLAQAVETALASDPGNRFQSAGQMIAALSESIAVRAQEPRRRAFRAWMAVPIAAALAWIVWLAPGSRQLLRGSNPHLDYIKGQNLLDHYYQPHSMENAIQLFERTIGEDPRFALAYASLCRAYVLEYHDREDPSLVQKAQDACGKALALDRELPAPHITLGMLYTQTGKTDLAAQELRLGLGLDSKNAEAWAALAELYARQGRNQDIEPTLQKAADLAPMDWRWPNQLGTYDLTQGKLPEAATQYEKAAALTPDNARVWNNIGIVNRRQNRLAEAEAAYRKAVALDSGGIYLSNLGLVLELEGNYQGAAELYRKSADLNPADYLVRANLASVYERLGDASKARAAYLEAISLAEKLREKSPNDATLLSHLGSYYATVQMPEKSEPLLRQAAALAPEDPQVLYRVAEGYELMHRRDEALRWIARALARKYSLEALRKAPEMAGLIADPRFATISNAGQ